MFSRLVDVQGVQGPALYCFSIPFSPDDNINFAAELWYSDGVEQLMSASGLDWSGESD
jgi:hypothetical protein